MERDGSVPAKVVEDPVPDKRLRFWDIGIQVLRLLVCVWAIYMGAFYREAYGWATGALLLVSTGGMTTMLVWPSSKQRLLWPTRSMDALVAMAALLGFCLGSGLITALYWTLLGILVIHQVLLCCPKVGRRWPFGVLALLVGTLLMIWMIISTVQRHIMYPGQFETDVTIPRTLNPAFGLVPEHITFKSTDGAELGGWLLKPTSEAAARIAKEHPGMPLVTLWTLYGNGDVFPNALAELVPMMQRAYPNLQVFSFGYRGYLGSRDAGRPSQGGFIRDLDGAVAFLRSRGIDRVVAHGHSIGGALLLQVMQRHPGFFSGAILSNTFRSIPKVLESHGLGLLTPFIHDRWESEVAVTRTQKVPPTLLLSGRQDDVVPPSHMDHLQDVLLAQGSKVTWVEDPKGTHNDWMDMAALQIAYRGFLRGLFGYATAEPPKPLQPKRVRPSLNS